MIKVFFNKILEFGLNKFLALNPTLYKKILSHHNKVIQITFTNLSYDVFLVICSEKILVYSVYEGVPDTVMRGPFLSFVKQSLQNTGVEKEITIEGDMELAQEIHHLIKHVDIDWEEYLSFITGDVVVYQMNKLISSLKSQWGETSSRMIQNTMEYVQEEKRLIPTREEVEDFYEETTHIRQGIERLEARLHRLQERKLQ